MSDGPGQITLVISSTRDSIRIFARVLDALAKFWRIHQKLSVHEIECWGSCAARGAASLPARSTAEPVDW
eukprot:11512538-Karenia_brevis.AAC.1